MTSNRRRPGWPRWCTALVVLALAHGVAAVALGPAAAAQPGATRAGDVAVVSPSNRTRVLGAGTSATTFTLRLPDGAECPGDSANDDYRVQSFLVPADTDPGTLVYKSIGPAGSDQIALYDTDTNQFVQSLTEMNATPGLPGVIPAPPALTFAVYGPADVTPGPHRMGIACTLFNETTRYWDVAVDVAVDAADPAGPVSWRVEGAAQQEGGSSSAAPTVGVVLVLLGAGVAISTVLVRRRRRDASIPPSKETI